MKDIAIILENKPGALADLGETLGKANINMEGLCGSLCNGEDIIHVLVEEHGKAYNVLERAGFKIKEVNMTEFEKIDGGLSCLSLRF